MDLEPTLKNDLIIIRPMKEEDRDALYQVASDPLIWDQHRFKRNVRSEFDVFFDEAMRSKGALVIIDNVNRHIIGCSSYKMIEGFPDGLEIGGTFMSREYWGKQYNGTIKRMMINHALHYVDYLLFYVHKNNIRSQRALEKLKGMKVTKSEFPQIPEKSDDHLRYLVCEKCGPDSIAE